MWLWVSAALLLAVCRITTSRGSEFAIQSLNGAGQLIFNELSAAESYRVEWAPTPAGPWTGFTDERYTALNDIKATGSGNMTCWVPMDALDSAFYRIVAATISSPDGMVLIPAGTNAGTNPDSDLGAYTLTVDAFYMDKYEVTHTLWDEVYTWAVANGYSFDFAGSAEGADHPVHTVNWYDVIKWCNARSEKEGFAAVYTVKGAAYKTGQADNVVQSAAMGYRLPTNEEWEYAARGGAENQRFPWDDTDTIQHTRANYKSLATYTYDTSATRGLHPAYAEDPSAEIPATACTSPVGAFEPNGYGLYGMAGNVQEWCFDWHPDFGTSFRTLRGGTWITTANNCRVGALQNFWPEIGFNHAGFRTVLPVDQ